MPLIKDFPSAIISEWHLATQKLSLTVSGYLHTLHKNHSQEDLIMSSKFVLGKKKLGLIRKFQWWLGTVERLIHVSYILDVSFRFWLVPSKKEEDGSYFFQLQNHWVIPLIARLGEQRNAASHDTASQSCI